MSDITTSQRCAFVALLGAPNAGKSTLLNHLVGSKISIVTPKVQTTRVAIRGIVMHGDAQLVFIDTPGIFSPKRSLEKAIVSEAWRGVDDADVLMLLIDSKKGLCRDTNLIIEALKQRKKKALVLLNKVDTVSHEHLLPLAKATQETDIAEEIYMISGLTGDGVIDIRNYLASHAPQGPWMYPPDHISDAPTRFLAAEITREKLFMNLQQELPYSTAVETEQWKEGKDGSVTIHQTIYVTHEGQKKIVLGSKGEGIKRIGETSRKELERVIGKRVHLFLFVKVKENWMDNPMAYIMPS